MCHVFLPDAWVGGGIPWGRYALEFGDGATPSQSTEMNPSVIYNIPGSHDVKLVVSNESGTSEIIKENYITILDSDVAPFIEQFEDVNFPNNTNSPNWFIKPTGTEPSWARTGLASFLGSGSARICSQYLSADDITHELISPELDFSNQTTSTESPLSLYFDLAYAKTTYMSTYNIGCATVLCRHVNVRA